MKRALAVGATAFLTACASLTETFSSKQAAYGCQTADVVTTAVALQVGFVEANPVVDWIIGSVGFVGLAVIKIGIVGTYMAYLRKKNGPHWVLAAANGTTCAIAAHNLLLIMVAQ